MPCSRIRPSINFTRSAFTAWPRPSDIKAGGEALSLGHAEWLALLLEREASLRRDKRLSKRLQYAKLRQRR